MVVLIKSNPSGGEFILVLFSAFKLKTELLRSFHSTSPYGKNMNFPSRLQVVRFAFLLSGSCSATFHSAYRLTKFTYCHSEFISKSKRFTCSLCNYFGVTSGSFVSLNFTLRKIHKKRPNNSVKQFTSESGICIAL